MGAEGGDISRMGFAIIVGMTEDVVDLMGLGLKCCCYNPTPVSLGESFACARCDVFIGALQTFPLSLSSWKTTEALPESQGYLLLCLINMHVFGTCVGSAGMLSSISFFIYMRLGGVTYGASWLS